ncbi:MAG: Glutamate-5-semialdehyde dehydrogenase, partial [Bacteroidota bacterium]
MGLSEEQLLEQFAATRKASTGLAMASTERKQVVLQTLASLLEQNSPQILAANQVDMDAMALENPMRDRLLLTTARIQDLANSVREVALLPDPSGQVLLQKTLSNGLDLQKIAVPLGVVGVIYESRPNVTIDVAALCVRSGNA